MVDIVIKTRDEITEDYQRAYKLRNPSAVTGPGTQPYLDAISVADVLIPMYANAQAVGANIGLDNQSGAQLEMSAKDTGLTPVRVPSVGSTGYVTLRTSAGGTAIVAGDGLREPVSGLRFTFADSAVYTNGSQARIAATDTGPATNLKAGTVLQISNPRPGCAPTCVVAALTDGRGLTGGADQESDDSLRERIRSAKRYPGSSAEYKLAAENTPGVQLQSAFVYPAPYGPGTVAVTFTTSGSPRTPTASQLSAVLSHLSEVFPGSDIIYMLPLIEQPADIVVRVTWANGESQWLDNAQWPQYLATSPGSGSAAIVVDSVTSALVFTVKTLNGNYSTVTQPQVGQNLALFDASRGKFSRKRILTVSGTGPWTITCDPSYGASDSSYLPTTGQRISPWSNAMDLMVPIVTGHFAKLGPGEMRDPSYQGGRSARFPQSPQQWPAVVTQDLATALFRASGVVNVSVVEGIGTAATTHLTPHILTLGDFSCYPL